MMRALKVFSIAILALAAVIFSVSAAVGFMNRDETIPEIAAESGELEITCAYTEEELLAGVTASDGKDGDLTDQILVGDFSRFITPGVCDLTYVVFDSSGNMADLTRRVTFTDYHSPRFALSQPLCFEVGTTNNTDVRAMFTASDMLDGDLTDWITYIETDAYYSTPGDYTITMEVRNSFGDTVSYAFPIHILEENTVDAEILLTEPVVYLSVGDSFDPADYLESAADADGYSYTADQLTITSGVDTSAAGLYEVRYQLEAADEEGNLTSYGETWLTVIVEEVPA